MARTKARLSKAEILAQIPAARAREASERKTGLRAESARYDASTGFVMLTLTNGYLFGFPAAGVPGLEKATHKQRAALELSPSGAGVHWDELDADISVPGLLADAIGREASMSALARAGGSVSSDAKAAAARANGAKGGRPRKKETNHVVDLMEHLKERLVKSPTRAAPATPKASPAKR